MQQSPRECKARVKIDFQKLSTGEKVEVITARPRKVPALFARLLHSKEFGEYANRTRLLLLRGSNLSNDDVAALLPLLLLHPDKVLSHLILPENSHLVNLLHSVTARAAQESTQKAIHKLYQEVNIGSKKWNEKVRPILERLLPHTTIDSSYMIRSQQKRDLEDGVIGEMGLCWKLMYYRGRDDDGVQSVPYIVTWFSPKVFFQWLLSQPSVEEVLNLPSNILLGMENIDAYAQFRYSGVGNEYVQYQFNPVTDLYLPRSLLLLIPLARARCKDSHGLVHSLFRHVITEMRSIERDGMTIGAKKFGEFL